MRLLVWTSVPAHARQALFHPRNTHLPPRHRHSGASSRLRTYLFHPETQANNARHFNQADGRIRLRITRRGTGVGPAREPGVEASRVGAGEVDRLTRDGTRGGPEDHRRPARSPNHCLVPNGRRDEEPQQKGTVAVETIPAPAQPVHDSGVRRALRLTAGRGQAPARNGTFSQSASLFQPGTSISESSDLGRGVPWRPVPQDAAAGDDRIERPRAGTSSIRRQQRRQHRKVRSRIAAGPSCRSPI